MDRRRTLAAACALCVALMLPAAPALAQISTGGESSGGENTARSTDATPTSIPNTGGGAGMLALAAGAGVAGFGLRRLARR